MGQRPRSFSYMLHLDSGSRTLHFSHATLSLVSLSVSLVSLVSPSACSPRGGHGGGSHGGAALGARCAAGRRSSSRSTSTRPYSHTRIASSPRNGRARSTVNRRPRPEPPSACVPRDPGPYLVAAGRASTLSHILSKSPCCTPYSLRGPTPVGNAPCVRAVGRAMAGVANS
jgi:hypothetical protein